jgi:hypothetical protein
VTDWRLARALAMLRIQVNALAPKRSKEWDGSIGDTAHSARKSDHNPDEQGVVHAIDITHDPAGGCDVDALAETIRASADRRVKYLIRNRRICSSTVAAWQWRPYDGPNPHDHHLHISVTDIGADDPRPWNIS